ncbi:unnamed protein product [Peniophora sp. CBMAI 1063]|nr:unnamed protein product [Peniophora sp. CBMAI 1063]
MRLRNIFHRRIKSRSTTGIDINSFPSPALTPAPVDKTAHLPDDIIYEIFEAAAVVYPPCALATSQDVPTLRDTDTRLGWIVLTHVCRRWRTLGLSGSLAGLWARVVCMSSRREVIAELSRRAKGHPVTIDLSRFNTLDGHGLLRHYHAILPLEVWAIHNISRAGVLVSPGGPMLRHLKDVHLTLPDLRQVRFGGMDVPLDFNPRWELPRLRCAHLSMTLVPHTWGATLREIHIGINTSLVPLGALHAFLRSCPLLEFLDVSVTGAGPFQGGHHFEDERDARSGPIVLDHLQSARVVVGSDRMLSDLWRPIRHPPKISFELSYELDKFETGSVALPNMETLLDVCQREMDHAMYDKLEVDIPRTSGIGRFDMRVRLSSSSTETMCELSFPTDNTTRLTALSILPAFIPHASFHITTLALTSLAASTVSIDLNTLGTLLRALGSVTVLELKALDIWSVASHILVLRQAKLEPVLPSLRTLVLSSVSLIPGAFKLSDDPEVHRERTRQWWDTIASALAARKYACGVGGIRSLKLEGCWTGRRGWSESEDWWGMENLTGRKLVAELFDRRVWED